jgi:hypothetical protein
LQYSRETLYITPKDIDNKGILNYINSVKNIRIICLIWEVFMALVKKTVELDQEQINRIKLALKTKSEKEAINFVLKQFDTDIQLAEITLMDAGSFDFEEV